MSYLLVYGLLLLVGILTFNRPAERRACLPVVAVFLFAFAAFRYEVGCDWRGYETNYESARFMTEADALSEREPAYWLLLTQLHSFGLEYPYLNFFMAIPFFWGLVRLASFQPDPLAVLILSFPVLVINLPMSGIRQGAAVGFVCLALVAFRRRQIIRYFVFVLLASLLHTSAAIFWALAPFVKLPLSRTAVFAAGVLMLPGAYYMSGDVAGFYTARYVDTGVDAAGAVYRSGMLASVGGYFLLVLRRTYQKTFRADYPLALIGSWMMIATLAILPLSSVISDRLGYYVAPIQLLIMAAIPQLTKGRYRLLVSATPYAALGMALVVWTSYSTLFDQCYLPYQTWWHRE